MVDMDLMYLLFAILISNQYVLCKNVVWHKDGIATDADRRIASAKKVGDSVPRQNKDITIQISRNTDECLHAHNMIRQQHGGSNLKWDPVLAYYAERWAVMLAETNKFVHSKMDTYGENLYQLWGTKTPGTCAEAVQAWYAEVRDYEYKAPGFSDATGHFTQLVWLKTDSVGVGIAYIEETKDTWIVARYKPRGNTEDQKFQSEVLPPKQGSHIPSVDELSLPNSVPTIITVHVGRTEVCVDLQNCENYVKQGNCEDPYYKPWMEDNCMKSCKFCDPGPPRDGGWTEWQIRTSCSAKCRQSEERLCVNPFPLNGGKQCVGSPQRLIACSGGECSHPLPNLKTCRDEVTTPQCNAYISHCQEGIYKPWMEINCRLSCGLCCKDIASLKQCEGYKSHCISGKYKEWMHINCLVTCGLCCGNIADMNTCVKNYEKGYCTGSEYTPWMHINCKQTCGVC